MSIFNSLGSNYSPSFVLQYFFAPSSSRAKSKLEDLLGKFYGGKTTLTYKGRQALELALERSNLPTGSQVGINGFTCYVVYEAIQKAGYQPVFIDVAEGQLNFGLDELRLADKNYGNLRAIVVQNTLGLPAPIENLLPYCKQHNIMVIEDLAHSLGMIYANGQEAGKVGELVMLSFSQDKPLDVVAGGALVDRRPKAETGPRLKQISWRQRFINRTYPFWTSTIRLIYGSGLGRFLHAGLKTLRLLATPMSDNLKGNFTMTTKAATQLVKRWGNRQQEFEHRRMIADIYRQDLPPEIQFDAPTSGTLYLRFPIKIKNRAAFIDGLKNFQIYIGDVWYDAPVGPKRYLPQTNYKSGQCPRSEKLSAEIVNLPTHINVTSKQAKIIAERVNQWLKSK